jgi:hypothetical protein
VFNSKNCTTTDITKKICNKVTTFKVISFPNTEHLKYLISFKIICNTNNFSNDIQLFHIFDNLFYFAVSI